MKKFKSAQFLPAILFLFYLIPSIANASPPINSDTWHFLFAPYGWLSSIDGDITVKDKTKHIHVPFKNVLKDLDFAGEAHIEGGYGPLTLMIDPSYFKLSTDVDKRILKTTINSEMTLIDMGGFYRVFASNIDANQSASLEVLGGARYFDIDNEFEFERLRELNVSANTSLFSPIVGGRIKYAPTPKTLLWLRGDYGGFNVDNVKKTWSSTIGLSYTIHPHIDLGIAYRALGIDFTVKKAAVNTVLYGPMIGIAFYS